MSTIKKRTAVVSFAMVGLICAQTTGAEQWQHYGGGLDGVRFARTAIVTPDTVSGLEQAWVYRTGDATRRDATRGDGGYFGRRSSFKATPIIVDGKLVFSSGFNRVYALDPATGAAIWQYDPEVDFTTQYSEMFTSRGVAAWTDPHAESDATCATRIYLARLIAIDAANGHACETFGKSGSIDLSKGVANFRRGDYSMTSPPAVVNGVVITGSSVGDNGGIELDSGVVRGWDARTGALLWRFDPIPRDSGTPGWETWENGSGRRTGAANVWSTIAADAARDDG